MSAFTGLVAKLGAAGSFFASGVEAGDGNINVAGIYALSGVLTYVIGNSISRMIGNSGRNSSNYR